MAHILPGANEGSATISKRSVVPSVPTNERLDKAVRYSGVATVCDSATIF
jgi:hypothetical protein